MTDSRRAAAGSEHRASRGLRACHTAAACAAAAGWPPASARPWSRQQHSPSPLTPYVPVDTARFTLFAFTFGQRQPLAACRTNHRTRKFNSYTPCLALPACRPLPLPLPLPASYKSSIFLSTSPTITAFVGTPPSLLSLSLHHVGPTPSLFVLPSDHDQAHNQYQRATPPQVQIVVKKVVSKTHLYHNSIIRYGQTFKYRRNERF